MANFVKVTNDKEQELWVNADMVEKTVVDFWRTPSDTKQYRLALFIRKEITSVTTKTEKDAQAKLINFVTQAMLPPDKRFAHVLADWLEENGESSAAEKIRNTF